MVGNAEVFLGLFVIYDNLLKLFLGIRERAYLLCSFFRAYLDLTLTDLTIVVAVDVSKEGKVHRPVVLFL
jgi:hypothetical protein